MKKTFFGAWPGRARLLLLWLALLAGPGAAATAPGPSAATPPALPADRGTPLSARRPDAARLRELAARREFRYVEAEARPSFWDAFWARLWRWLDELKGTPGGQSTWRYAEYAVYAALVGALLYGVLKVLQVDLTGVFGRAPRRAALDYDTAGENIHELDFRSRIAEAEAAGNYRLATRLGYLALLKQLSDQGLIRWQPDKTNHAYLAELGAGPLREAFREATRLFEYVWYGELSLNARLYRQVQGGQQAAAGLVPGGRAAAPAPASTLNAPAA